MHNTSGCFQKLLEMATLVRQAMEASVFMWQLLYFNETPFQKYEEFYLHLDQTKRSQIFSSIFRNWIYYEKLYKIYQYTINQPTRHFLGRKCISENNPVNTAAQDVFPFLWPSWINSSKSCPTIMLLWFHEFYCYATHLLFFKFS